jgi:hypothetical protein
MLISVFYTLFAGSLVTFDGNQYLATAHSISKLSITQGYLFGRPPGYPTFLAIILKINHGDRFLIFIQVLLITSTALLLLRRISFLMFKHFEISLPKWMLYLLLFLPTISGYGTTVLQQPLFIIETNLALFFLLGIFMEKAKRYNYFCILCLVPITIWTGEGLFPFCVGVILLGIWFGLRRPELCKPLAKTLLIAFIFIIPISSASLNLFQKWGARQPGTVTYGIPQGNLILKYPSFFIKSPQTAISDLLEDYITQSGLSPALQAKGLLDAPSIPMFENRVHAENTFSMSRRCGVADTSSGGSWYKYSRTLLHQSCAPFSVPTLFSTFFYLLGAIASFFAFIFVPLGVFLLLVFWRGRDRQTFRFLSALIIPAILLRVSYILLGFQPDRYVVQFIPEYILVGLITTKLIVNSKADKLKNK